jgi:NDP-sugar pyrophosphorylase family protein
VIPALLLTAGLGTRLRPLSEVRAKGAVPVAGEPLARRIIRWLVAAGITDIVLNLHHRPATLTVSVGDGRDLGARVRYSWEQPVLGSAGGPRHALPLVDSDQFLIVNGDTLTNVDLAGVLARHRASGALVTLALVPNKKPEQYGGVLVADGAVIGFTGRGARNPNYHFVGVQVAERGAFESLPDGVPSESVADLYPRLLRERSGAIAAFVSDASFEDIGTPRDYLETTFRVAEREGRCDPWQLGAGCRVAADAVLRRTVLWDRVSIGEGAALSECIVADDVTVAAGARLERCCVTMRDGAVNVQTF